MTKFSSFKEQQLITESWRAFLVEEQPVGQQQAPAQQQAQTQQAPAQQQAQTQQAPAQQQAQTQQAPAQQQPQLDVRKPADIKNMILAKARGKAGSAGPDQITKQNIQKNNKVLASTRSVTQPLQAAQVILQLFNQLSPEDQAEAAKAAQQILQTKPQQQQQQVQKESLIKEDLTISALQALGGGDLTKGLQRIGTGAFLGAIAIGLAQAASGDFQSAGTTTLKTIVNSMQKLYSSNNIADLGSIIGTVVDVAAPGKRDSEESSMYEGAHLAINQLKTPKQPQPVKEVFHYNGKQFDSFEAIDDYKSETEEEVYDAAKHGIPAHINTTQKSGINTAKEILKKAIEDLSNIEINEAATPTLDDGSLVCAACLLEVIELSDGMLLEAKYQGRTVTLNKPMKGDVKKSKVYVKDPSTGNVKKVNFGDPNMTIKKNIPARRKSFRARHNCDNPGPKTKARYWSCRAW